MSRSSTRSFTGSREPSRCAAPCAEQLDARSQAIDTLAHRIDTAQELLALVARHEIGAFVPQVLREVLQRGAGGPAAPVKREAGEASELMRRHIPEQQRQFFLEVRAQEPGQLAEELSLLLGDVPAHQLGRLARLTLHWSRRAAGPPLENPAERSEERPAGR